MATLGRVEDRLVAVEARLLEVEKTIELGLKKILEKIETVMRPERNSQNVHLTPGNWPIIMTAEPGEFKSINS